MSADSLSFAVFIYYTARILECAQDGNLKKMFITAALSVAFLILRFVIMTTATLTRLIIFSDCTVKIRGDIIKDIFRRPLKAFRRQDDAYYMNLLGNDTDMYVSERLNMIP